MNMIDVFITITDLNNTDALGAYGPENHCLRVLPTRMVLSDLEAINALTPG